METFLTSDHHFFHKNIIRYCNRPFSSVEEMNQVMIEKWNNRVGKEDMVIHLGDFALGPTDSVPYITKQLNGDIILIKGNHDHYTRTFWEDRIGFKKYFTKDIIIVSDRVTLSHWPKKIHDTINLHGHVHNNLPRYHRNYPKVIHVNLSVDVWDFFPVNLNDIEVLSEKDRDDIKSFFSSFIKIDFSHLER